jgi:hypothetical protein
MKRYEFHCDGFDNFDMREAENGEYVLFDDCAQAIATARAEALREAADRADTYMTCHAADAGFWDVSTLCKIILTDKQEGKNG